MIRAVIALAALALAGCASLAKPNVSAEPAALKAGQYSLDKDHASLLFKIGHLGFSKFVGRFERFDASLDFDEADPSKAKVEAIIDMTSLDVADDEFARTLTGPDWFDAATYPEAVFTTESISNIADGKGVLTGQLTMCGETVLVHLDVAFNGGARDLIRGAYVVGFSAKGTLSRGEFGVDKYDGIVGDEVEIEIEAEFVRR